MYRVVLDGEDIFNFDDPHMLLLNPSLEMELNTAGSFEFTIPPGHELYEDNDGTPLGLNYFYGPVHPLHSTVEVYEDQDVIWWGRPVEVTLDFWRQKQVYCEGALAFFCDSIQRYHEYNSVSLHSFFQAVIAAHNTQVPASRQFTVGEISVEDKTIYRKLNYETTFDVLKKMCLDAEGGYFYLRRENGVNYIDWLPYVQLASNQHIEFGLNLLDVMAEFDAAEIATCVIPLGDSDADTGAPLTIESVNGGSDTLESGAVERYGRITKAVPFSGVADVYELLNAGREYLENTQFNNFSIECTAADLHGQNENYNSFRLGMSVLCRSAPHLLRRQYPITKISVRLDSADKQITLGTTAKRTLTRIQKDDIENIPNKEPSDDDDDGGGSDSYAVTGIAIASPPTKRFYSPGETLDYDGLKVVAVCSDRRARDITANCVLTPANGSVTTDETGTLTADVQYVWGNETFSASFDLTVRNPVISILVNQHPNKERYNVGEALDFTGLQILAESENGNMPDITQECEYSPEDGSIPAKYGNILIDVWYQGQFFPSVFSMLVLPSETGTFTVTFVNGNEVLQVVNDVPYQGAASYTGSTPTPSESQFGMTFAGWNPHPSYVTSDMVCYAQFLANFIADDEIQDSWSEIIANHGAPYAIGSYKLLPIGTVDGVQYGAVRMRKVAVGEAGSTSTWVAMDPLAINRQMSPNDDNCRSWATSELRRWLNSTVLNALPVFMREGIFSATKYSRSFSPSDGIFYPNMPTVDALWIPSRQEVFGDESTAADINETMGVKYSVYTDNASRLIGNSSGEAWLRTVYDYYGYFYYMNRSSGSPYSGSINSANDKQSWKQVLIGFCL